MRKRLLGLFAGATIVFAACGGAASPSPSSPAASQPGSPAASASGSPAASADGSPGASADGSAAPSASAGAGDINLFESEYPDVVEEGTAGGQIIIGDWQEANQFNPYYLGQVTEANVASAAWATLV
nr:hypothetical protein [Chloroflexota bacterium]